jgi:hypothetical protein
MIRQAEQADFGAVIHIRESTALDVSRIQDPDNRGRDALHVQLWTIWQGFQSGEQTFGDELEFNVAKIRQLKNEDKDQEGESPC